MPSLAELTDYYGEQPTALPVEPLYLPSVNTNDMQLSTGEGEPTRITVRPEPRPEPDGRSIRQKLMGEFGERYQLWPEKIVREGLAAAGDVMRQGTVLPGLRREDITDIPKPDMPTKDSTWLGKLLALAPVAAQPGDDLIEKAQAISALAGTGGIAGADATLGATPFLRPALKYKDKLYKGKEGQQHQDIIPKELYPEFERMAMSGEDISHYNFGFVNDKGQFLNREKALDYGINTGLIDPHAGKYGALTSTLMADSSKPGTAIEAMAKTASPFYSALEHNVGNVSQSKMTGEQWLGTLSNKPGVKPEEMQWTGLQEFLNENKGKVLSKEQVQEHLQNNKVELKEVNKGELKFNKNSEYALPEVIRAAKQSGENPGELEMTLANDGNAYRALTKKFPQLSDDEDWAAKVSKSVFGGDTMPTGTTKYSYDPKLQLSGGENYREMLLTLPKKEHQAVNDFERFKQQLELKHNTHFDSAYDVAKIDKALGVKYQELLSEAQKVQGESGLNYKSSHWDEPNILAHVRMNDRTIDGKKSLHLEEIQSDWHQQGRDKGYKDPTVEKKLNENHAKTEAAIKELWDKSANIDEIEQVLKPLQDERSELLKNATYSVPDAPFKKSWHELALKRMIREAAEKGYDRLSWTPGEAQAARYDLSKSIDKVTYDKHGTIAAYDKRSGERVIEKRASEKELADIVGKEAAEKLIKMKPDEYGNKILNNADLKIGGEGMKGFYDQIIPKALEKIGKEHGVKVKQSKIPVTKELRIKQKNVNEYSQDIHYIDIPQSLKDHAMHKGFPLFSKGGHMLMPVDHEPDFGDK